MRTSTLITGAALAASAFAGPLFRRDDVVVEVVNTVTDVAYATVIVTQTDVSGPAPTPNEPAAPPAPPAETTSASHYGHRLSWSRPSDEAPAQPEVTVVTVTAQEGSTSAWTSSWASTWVVTPSAVATTTAAPAATTQVTQAAAAPAGKATTYQERVLAHHNVHRANHSASALVWDDALANTAAIIASTCIYAHSMNVNGGGYGQNIAAGVEANNVSAVITELFYNGEVGYYNNLYGQASPDMSQFEKWGHFSQLVWKGTTKVGCATQYCSGGLANTGQYVAPHFTVCNYGNPGNYAGEYAANIGAPLNRATADWSFDL